MKTRRKLVLSAGAVVLVGLLVIILFAARPSQADAQKGTVSAIAVEVTPVIARTVTQNVSAVGTIAAMRDVVVSSETAGRITRVAVKVGDVVRQGQTLVQVDDDLKEIAVEQARAQLLAAETNHNKAQKDFQRAETLYRSGDIADVEYEGMRLAMLSAEAQHKSALVALKLAQRQYDDTRIKAPVSGVVASKRVEVGEMVSPGREVANIVDLSNLKVKLSIPEEQIGKIQLNQPAALRVDPLGKETFAGQVYSIGAKTETPTGHTYPVEVIVRGKNITLLKVGMFARVDVNTGAVPNALVVSKESIIDEESDPSVFVVENSVARRRSIKLGMRDGELYEVTDGLNARDTVVSFGQKGLKDGSPVQYK